MICDQCGEYMRICRNYEEEEEGIRVVEFLQCDTCGNDYQDESDSYWLDEGE